MGHNGLVAGDNEMDLVIILFGGQALISVSSRDYARNSTELVDNARISLPNKRREFKFTSGYPVFPRPLKISFKKYEDIND